MLTGNPFFAMRILLSVTLLTILLIPATASAVEPCAVAELGVYAESRLRAGLRPTHRCTESQARYLRGLFGDAHRAYSTRQREYTQWLSEVEANDVAPVSPSSDIRSARRTYRLIRRR